MSAPALAPARVVPPAPGSLPAALRRPVATLRWFWPAYLTPGRPGRPTDRTELGWIYAGWLICFLLKMLGSTWDVSWHFRWLRDDLAPPHLLNSVGTGGVVLLVIFSSYTGYGVDRGALRLMQWGIGTFLLAIPLDILNHRINGLDITSWSPTHGVLYLGTAIMLAGALRGWWLYAAPGRRRTLVSLGLWLFFVENVLFPNQHQEYGVLSLAAYRAGHATAEPSLLDFARAQGQTPTDFMLPVPSWVHPTWLVCAGLLALIVARKVVGLRWTASVLAGAYVGYRCLAWVALVAGGFPPSDVPFVLLAGAVLVDLAASFRLPGLLAGLLVTAGVYGAGALQDAAGVLPPWNWQSAPFAAVALALLWGGVDLLSGSSWLGRWRAPVEPGRPAVPAEVPPATGVGRAASPAP